MAREMQSRSIQLTAFGLWQALCMLLIDMLFDNQRHSILNNTVLKSPYVSRTRSPPLSAIPDARTVSDLRGLSKLVYDTLFLRLRFSPSRAHDAAPNKASESSSRYP
jgi:hypothetical protein